MSGAWGGGDLTRQCPWRGSGTVRTARQTLAVCTSGAALTVLDIPLFMGSSEGPAPSLCSLVYLGALGYPFPRSPTT